MAIETNPAGVGARVVIQDGDGIARLAPSFLLPFTGLVGSVLVGAGMVFDPAVGVALLATIIGGLLILRSPVAGVLLVVALAPVLPGLRRGFPVPGLRLSEILIVGVALVALVLGDPQRRVKWRTFDWVAFAYVVLTPSLLTINLVRLGEGLTTSAVGTMLGPLQYFLLYRTVVTYIRTDRQKVLTLRLVLLASVPISVLAVLQVFELAGVPDLIVNVTDREALFAGWDYSRQARATSLFPHWHLLGGYLMLVLILGTGLLLGDSLGVMRRGVLQLILASAAVALAFTGTIAPMGGAVAGALLVGWLSGRLGRSVLWLATACLLVAIAAGPYLVQRYENQVATASGSSSAPQSIRFRVSVWQDDHLPALEGRWATGYGPELPPEVVWRFTENVYLTLLFRGGVPLLGIFVALLFFIASNANRARSAADPILSRLGSVVLATVIVLVPTQMIAPYLTFPGITHLLWVLIGLLMAPLPARRLGPFGYSRLNTPIYK